MLSVIVSYFSSELQKVVVHHLESVTVIKVNSMSVFNVLDKLFTDNSIPWQNLVSILMDSCNVTRGSKAGLEQLIKTKRATHLVGRYRW